MTKKKTSGILDPILVATDLSVPSRHATDRACRIAATNGARLTMLHVVSRRLLDELRDMIGANSDEVAGRIEAMARQSLAELAADPERNHGTQPDTRLATGAVLGTIHDIAETMNAGLLVVGARGEDYLRHAFLGSTAMRLLRKARRNVLLVRAASHEDYRRILVPIDFSPLSNSILDTARALAPGAHLVLIHAFELPFEGKLSFAGVDDAVIRKYRAEMREELTRRLHSFADASGLDHGASTLLVRHGEAAQVIIEQEQELECDLVVMGKHGNRDFEDLLLGSVTKHVLAEAHGDVLVVCEGDD